jgi:tRNA pseudouridine55 synthase
VEVERQARPVTIHRLQLLAFRPGPRPVAYVDVVCSKGTYIRTLAADIGDKLGVGAHMSYLVRTRSGSFTLPEAATLEELAAGTAPMLSPAAALGKMPKYGVAPNLRPDQPEGTTVALLDSGGDLLALATVTGTGIKLLKVFA